MQICMICSLTCILQYATMALIGTRWFLYHYLACYFNCLIGCTDRRRAGYPSDSSRAGREGPYDTTPRTLRLRRRVTSATVPGRLARRGATGRLAVPRTVRPTARWSMFSPISRHPLPKARRHCLPTSGWDADHPLHATEPTVHVGPACRRRSRDSDARVGLRPRGTPLTHRVGCGSPAPRRKVRAHAPACA